jgi:hypothetical protein
MDALVTELKHMQGPGDDDIRVAQGASAGLTRVTGFRRAGLRTVLAIAAGHGYEASVCTHEGARTVVIEVAPRKQTSAPALLAGEGFATTAARILGADQTWSAVSGSCTLITLMCSSKRFECSALECILAVTRVVDIWCFCDRIVILYAKVPTHTAALTHLREQRPELFSPKHLRWLATKQCKRTRRIWARGHGR